MPGWRMRYLPEITLTLSAPLGSAVRNPCSACMAAMSSMPCSKSVQGEPVSCTILSADTPSLRMDDISPAVHFITLDPRLQYTKAFVI